MAIGNIARLSYSNPREVWTNEARDFTPWLQENLDFLSDAIGMDLEFVDSEVAVEQFSADIIAKHVHSEDRVLIENQLEISDHRHLGQVLTYLAGLDCDIVVWIAPEFSDAHLSAVRWLNRNTLEHFSFFAVRLRWHRYPTARTHRYSRRSRNRIVGTQAWQGSERYSIGANEAARGFLESIFGEASGSIQALAWLQRLDQGFKHRIDPRHLVCRNDTCGLYLRGPFGEDGTATAEFVKRNAAELDAKLGPSKPVKDGYYYLDYLSASLAQRDRWSDMIDWLEEKRKLYMEIVAKLDGRCASAGI